MTASSATSLLQSVFCVIKLSPPTDCVSALHKFPKEKLWLRRQITFQALCRFNINHTKSNCMFSFRHRIVVSIDFMVQGVMRALDLGVLIAHQAPLTGSTLNPQCARARYQRPALISYHLVLVLLLNFFVNWRKSVDLFTRRATPTIASPSLQWLC